MTSEREQKNGSQAAKIRQERKKAVLSEREKNHSRIYLTLRWAVTPLKAIHHEILHLKFRRKRSALLAKYLAGDGFHGLHIGCGTHHKAGWINTDILTPRLPWKAASKTEREQDFPLDARFPLPFPDGCLDVIYGEHVIEHIDKDEAIAFLHEAIRVLKPGGVLRLSTPDLDGTYRTFLRIDPEVDLEAYEPYWFENEWSPEFWINATFRYWGHRFLWNLGLIEQECLAAGFSSVWRVQKGETRSSYTELEDIESRVAVDDEPFARFIKASSLNIEATK